MAGRLQPPAVIWTERTVRYSHRPPHFRAAWLEYCSPVYLSGRRANQAGYREVAPEMYVIRRLMADVPRFCVPVAIRITGFSLRRSKMSYLGRVPSQRSYGSCGSPETAL